MQQPFIYTTLEDQRQEQSSYKEFEASELYCPKCAKAVPVVKHLLLILPEGDKYEYRCRFCGTPVGEKMDKQGQYYSQLKK